MTTSLIEQLRAVRPDHQVEKDAHRFLLEAYSGSGGFAPRLSAPPASWWGAAATDYASNTIWSRGVGAVSSWLDRFPREDEKKYAGRAAVAYYENYVEPLTDLKCSYVLREPFASHDEPDVVSAWKRNVDGDETTWQEWLPDIVAAAATLGWAPVLVDAPPVQDGLSRAQAPDAAPRLSMLFPSQLLEWSSDGKRLHWVKVRTDHIERDSWTSAPVRVERYAIWTPTTVTVYRVVIEAEKEPRVEDPVEYTHGFGRVPIAILRHGSGGDPLRGRPMHWSVAQLNKRLFNLASELDEHTRAQVFALLVYPDPPLGPNGEVDLGNFNGLITAGDTKNEPHYIAPPASVAATLTACAEAIVRSIYRLARVEFSRPSGAAVSGVSREYEFEQTNRALGDFARNIARFDLDVSDLVGAANGVAVEVRRKHRVDPPRSFAVQDLERDMKVAMDAVTLGLGETATTRIKQNVVRRVLPNLSGADQAKIDGELDAMAEAEASARAMALEVGAAGLAAAGETKDDPPGEGEDDDDVTDDQKREAA